MNQKERVLRTLEIEEPDIVPITEMDIEIPLMEIITGKKTSATTSLQTQVVFNRKSEESRNDLKIECYMKLDFDIIVVDLSAPENWIPKTNSNGTMVDLWGRVLMLDRQTRAWVPFSTIFQNPNDFVNFEFPDKDDPGWTFATEYVKKRIDEKTAIATFIRDPFAHAWEMFTPLNFVKWMYQEPRIIKKVIEKLTEFNIAIIKRVAESNVDLILSGGDYCEKRGPMVPVNFFKELIFPNLKKQVNAAHKYGIKFIKHTDGNINPIVDQLANIVDGLHSLDPTAGVEIGEIKKKYGDKLILIGNIAVDSLAQKKKKQIVEETKQCIHEASPGGGHILSSSNSWASGARLENCLAMTQIGRKYGVYPINF